MKVAILMPRSVFSPDQQKQLASAGEITFLEETQGYEQPQDIFVKLSKEAEILAIDPDNFGGFEKAKERVTALLEALPKVKAIALDTTSYGWIDRNYCKNRGLIVSNIPGYSREAVAEHALALMLSLAKRIIISDRLAASNRYKLEKGIELNGKTLGIIGLGNIGTRVAELGAGIGMKVIAYNHTPKKMSGLTMMPLEDILKLSDVISLHVTHTENNKNLIGVKELEKMKNNVIVINLVDRDIVDEKAMTEALKSGKVYSYAYEGQDLTNTPLAGVDNAIGIKPFGWYTRESINNLYQILTTNIVAFSQGKPQNTIPLQ